MKIKLLTILFISITIAGFSQKDSEVLFKVDGESFFVAEFKRVYEKNLEILADDNQKGVDNYLDLFIKFKLKLKEAKRLQLDTSRAYKREIETYRNQLIAPYLKDTATINKLVKDAYYRTKYMINASHILVQLPKKHTPADTLAAYTKIVKARKEILEGAQFEKVALEYSDDQSVKNNAGNLGYFTAFKMVYPFENAAFNTKVGEISTPFKTNFGYHIVKVNDLKLSKGEIEVAHILITDKSEKGQARIDSVYQNLKNGADFGKQVLKYTNDKSTVSNAGKLPRFGIGRMFKEFEDESFKLEKENDFSKPFKTRFGWHIIKLLKKYPVKPFNGLKEELTKRVKESGGARMSDIAMLKRLQKEYSIVVNEDALKIFGQNNIRGANKDTLQAVILTINKSTIKQGRFFDYIRNRRHKKVDALFNDFVNEEVMRYFKDNLKYTDPEFAYTLKEYEEGLVVFDLMQQKVWDMAVKDTLGLKTYFKNHSSKYNFKKLSENKGKVMNDYQTYLEEELITSLQKKYAVTIRKRVVNKLEKHYQLNE